MMGMFNMTAENYLSVTALTKYLKAKFDKDPYLDRVYLTGEISNFRKRPNAHQYFSLKDDKAKISAVMFKGAFGQLKFQPEEGMKVLVVGRISLYEASGNYQMYVEHMEPDGVGALYKALEQRKIALQSEGLFKEIHKQPLPMYPKRIAVITSPSGAVIKDIMTTVKRRYPIAQLVVFPTLVQGDKAAGDIVKRIKQMDELGDFDTAIVARGGGSIEDLWPFNEEAVARAIFEARTPIISSVGHETDVTIADLVADVRAATPTAAAELSVPVLTEEIMKVSDREKRLYQALNNQLKMKQQQLDYIKDTPVFKQPQRLYDAFSVQVDQLTVALEHSLESLVAKQEKEWQGLTQRLMLVHPERSVTYHQQALLNLQERLEYAMKQQLKGNSHKLGQLVGKLDTLSPLKTMSRGYSYVSVENHIVTSVSELSVGQGVEIEMHDGVLYGTINDIKQEEKE